MQTRHLRFARQDRSVGGQGGVHVACLQLQIGDADMRQEEFRIEPGGGFELGAGCIEPSGHVVGVGQTEPGAGVIGPELEEMGIILYGRIDQAGLQGKLGQVVICRLKIRIGRHGLSVGRQRLVGFSCQVQRPCQVVPRGGIIGFFFQSFFKVRDGFGIIFGFAINIAQVVQCKDVTRIELERGFELGDGGFVDSQLVVGLPEVVVGPDETGGFFLSVAPETDFVFPDSIALHHTHGKQQEHATHCQRGNRRQPLALRRSLERRHGIPQKTEEHRRAETEPGHGQIGAVLHRHIQKRQETGSGEQGDEDPRGGKGQRSSDETNTGLPRREIISHGWILLPP